MKPVLDVQTLLEGYAVGAFPMADESGRIGWFSPDPRAVFELATFKVPASLRPKLRKGVFDVRINHCFEQVMRCCADRPEGTWISNDVLRAYCDLHRAGFAHSVEVLQDGQLVGGLYGVSIGGAFFGESMFHHVTDASKVALVALVDRLQRLNFSLLDTQWSTPHLKRLGAIEIPRVSYMHRLTKALKRECRFDAPLVQDDLADVGRRNADARAAD